MTQQRITITLTANHGATRDLVEELEPLIRQVDPVAVVVHDASAAGEEPEGRIDLQLSGDVPKGRLRRFGERLGDWFFDRGYAENCFWDDPMDTPEEGEAIVVGVRLVEPTAAVDGDLVSQAVRDCLGAVGQSGGIHWTGTWQPPGGHPIPLAPIV